MLRRISIIGIDTFKNVLRHKTIALHAVFLILCAGLFNLFGHFSINPTLEYKMIQDVGLSFITLFGFMMSLFIGSSALRDEINSKTVYNILTLPVERWELFSAKFLGTLLSAIINGIIMVVILSSIIYLKFKVFWSGFHWIVLFMLMEFSIMSSIVLLLSLFDSIVLCFSLSTFFIILGNLKSYVMHLAEHAEIPGLYTFTKFVYFFIPNFEYYNIKNKILKDLTITHDFAFWAMAYTLVYLFFVLLLGSWIFSRKDL